MFLAPASFEWKQLSPLAAAESERRASARWRETRSGAAAEQDASVPRLLPLMSIILHPDNKTIMKDTGESKDQQLTVSWSYFMKLFFKHVKKKCFKHIY